MVVILYVVSLHHWFLSADLKRICKAIVEAASDEERLKAFAPIQEMMTFVQFANDECDYGMGLELGMDLFCYGSHVSKNSAFPHYSVYTHLSLHLTFSSYSAGKIWIQLVFQSELLK